MLGNMKIDLKTLRLPIMQCDPNCGECCGIVLCTQQEFDRVVAYAERHSIEPIRQGSTCPFYQGGKCAVYEVRPFPCKMFGHVPGMNCPRGYNSNITKAMEDRLLEAYPEPRVFLHEAIPGYSINDLKHEVEKAIGVEACNESRP